MITVKQLKEKYPNPIPARCLHITEKGYCVGGTLQCELDNKEVPFGGAFPSPHTLASVLYRANPHLNRFEARTLAGKITSANDTGEFERAWGYLERALTYYSPIPKDHALVPAEPDPQVVVDLEPAEEKQPELELA